MKKLKQLIIAGVTATIMLSSSVAFANTTTDKLQLMFDQLKTNPEFQNGQLYINAKFITKSGLVLSWDSETGSFVFGDSDESGIITPPATTPIVNPTLPEEPITKQISKDYIEYNGNIYYTVRDMIIKYNMSMNDVSFNSEHNTLVFKKTNKSLVINDKTNTIIKNGIPYIKESAFINCK